MATFEQKVADFEIFILATLHAGRKCPFEDASGTQKDIWMKVAKSEA